MASASVQLELGEWVIGFHKPADRFVHTIGLQAGTLDAPKPLPCLTSIPGDSADDWPVDVPLQEVVLEPIGNRGGRVALGVGKSGHGHWSVAVEPIGTSPLRVRWDVACKVDRPPERLCSCLEWAQATMGVCSTSQPSRLVLRCIAEDLAHRSVTIVPERGQLRWDSKRCVFWIEPDHVAFSNPTNAGTYRNTTTYRWCYLLEFDS